MISFPTCRLGAAALTCVTLAACQSTPQTNAVKAAFQGQTIQLTHVANINPDCTSLGEVVVKVSEQPAHGVVSIKSGTGFTAFVAGNPRSVCNIRPTPGVNVSYTPAAGYTGPDSLAVDIIFVNGANVVQRFNVDVK